jgi:hypothetical protein
MDVQLTCTRCGNEVVEGEREAHRRNCSPPRKLGSELIAERFPNARALWRIGTTSDAEPFTITAYGINGRVVLLQEFGDSRGNSWDVYVQASDSGEIEATLAAVEARVAR